MRTFLFVIILLLYSIRLTAQPSFVKDSLDTYINREMQRWKIPAVAVSVVYKGQTVFMKGYGTTEAGGKEKVNEHTLFQVASNSKAFTGTALSLLDYRKQLSLNDRVKKHLPYFDLYDEYAAENATIRDMLCHRIGFQTFQSDFLNWDARATRYALIENMRNVKPVHPFRSRYGYCNVCFLTAGEIIPAVTDTSWDDFIKYHFFLPMGMNRSSTTYQGITEATNAAKPYTLFENKLTRLDYAYIDALGPAASINSSVYDMTQWVKTQLDTGRLDGKEIFPKQVILNTWAANMLVRSLNSPLFPYRTLSAYGLGWFVEDYYGRRVIKHGGGANGFVTLTTLMPGEQAGFVVLTNTDVNEFYQALSFQLTEAFAGLPYRNLSEIFYQNYAKETEEHQKQLDSLKQIAASNPSPALSLESYTGTFKNEVYGTMEIIIDKGMLVMSFEYHPRLKGKLTSLGENDFLCHYSDVTYGIQKITFEVDANRISAVTIKVNDFIDYMPYRFVKKE
ncbi:MAG: serine hydrolase [Bacteroidia bacterium]|nr:serine hydrolase [Bacteroidia bacterium]